MSKYLVYLNHYFHNLQIIDNEILKLLWKNRVDIEMVEKAEIKITIGDKVYETTIDFLEEDGNIETP